MTNRGRIVLLRHGDVEIDGCFGDLDFLSSFGKQQMLALGLRLVDVLGTVGRAVVCHSKYARTLESGTILVQAMDPLDLVEAPWLNYEATWYRDHGESQAAQDPLRALQQGTRERHDDLGNFINGDIPPTYDVGYLDGYDTVILVTHGNIVNKVHEELLRPYGFTPCGKAAGLSYSDVSYNANQGDAILYDLAAKTVQII